jgi:hypothetical protein
MDSRVRSPQATAGVHASIDEIVAPHMIAAVGPQPEAASVREPPILASFASPRVRCLMSSQHWAVTWS